MLPLPHLNPNQTPTAAAAPVCPAHGAIRTPWRWGMAGMGIACFVMGAVGAMVPGLPTTVFLLLGSFFLTRSCPWLEERMLAWPVLRPYAQFVRSREPLSRTVRISAWTAMWTSILISLALLALADRLPVWLAAAIVLAGLAGTLAIARFRRA